MISLKLIEQYGFEMLIDGEPVGNICPSGDNHEWATYELNATGHPITPRLSTTDDILNAIDDLERAHYNKKDN